MNKVNCITINTDASYHPEYRVGGYAFTIVCDHFRIQKSGKFKIQPLSAEEAEIMCIGNAIALLLALPEIPKCDWLIINSDCKNGMRTIEKKGSDLGNKVCCLKQQLIGKIGCKHNKMRHVKAHSGKQDKRSIVNDWCDTEAKKWMRETIKDFNKKSS